MDAPHTQRLLEARGVTKRYPDGDVHALTGVDFWVDRGEYVAIMGPSGSGKSTLLSILGTLEQPTTGEVFFDGQALSTWRCLDTFRARKIGFVFQSFHLLGTLTALENVQIPMFEVERSATQRQRRAQDLLASVGMSHRLHHLPARLSIGERQRVAIARALANRPALLLADEPTGNLDSKNAEDVLALLDSLRQKYKMAIVLVTHSGEVAARADRVATVRDGQIVESPPLTAPDFALAEHRS